jgi:hypothetical protein
MLEPIVREIEVPCSLAIAFDVFVDMASWWPLERFSASRLGGGTTRELRVETREGGTIVEVSADGSEHLWGRFVAYESPEYLAMDFHIVHPDQLEGERPDDDFTRVEVRFTALADDRTRVRLTQTEWERLGDMAAMVRGGYGTAWAMILDERYAAACSA